MLDWLKAILGDAYTDDIDTKVSAEIGKSFVAKADFNTTNEAKKQLESSLAERDKQLKTLQESTGDAAALKEQIAQLQAANAAQAKTYAAEIKQLKINNAVETALVGAKAKNVKAAMALLNLDKAELSEDGTVKGLAEQIKALTGGPDTGFLFETSSNKNGSFKGLNPAEGGDNGGSGAKAPQEMSYTELCAYLEKNPDAKL